MPKSLKELIESSKDSKFYRHAIKKLSPDQQLAIETIASELSEQGATEPLSWAYSEVTENIAQRARFYVLKDFSCLTESVESNISLSSDHDENASAAYQHMCSVMGKDEVDNFLRSYGKGLVSSAIDIIDNGNCGSETLGWILSETDGNGEITGRDIGGLHEDWIDFNLASSS